MCGGVTAQFLLCRRCAPSLPEAPFIYGASGLYCGIKGRCLTGSVAPVGPSKNLCGRSCGPPFRSTIKRRKSNGKVDLRRIDVGSGGAGPAPLRRSRALLAVVLPIWPDQLCSLLRVQQLGAVHGNRPWYWRVLLRQSVSSAAGAVGAIGKAASSPPHGTELGHVRPGAHTHPSTTTVSTTLSRLSSAWSRMTSVVEPEYRRT
jgi:hypothetical protein